jgi:hypothetical protein
MHMPPFGQTKHRLDLQLPRITETLLLNPSGPIWRSGHFGARAPESLPRPDDYKVCLLDFRGLPDHNGLDRGGEMAGTDLLRAFR